MRRHQRTYIYLAFASAVFLAGCTTYTTRVDNAPGRPTQYADPGTPGPMRGVGIESQDIVSMTDRMMRDILANPTLASRTPPARVIVDAEYFRNEGSSPINKNILTDRLRVNLNRAANERMIFVGRIYVEPVEKERELKDQGVVDQGTIPQAPATMGADYRLVGRITTLDSIDPSTGMTSRYHHITFEMVNLETAQIVWSGAYEFKKLAQNDIIYR